MKASERIKQISKKYGYSHISSCLSCLPILEAIYSSKGKDDLVILDNAHAHVGHLVVREQYENLQNIEGLLKTYGIHCDRLAGCDASGGSLGHSGISIGLCLANRNRKVYTIVSDGSVCEGSFLESLRIAKLLNITNWEIHANFNGYTAVAKIDINYWEQFIKGFGFPVIFHHTYNGDGFDNIDGHYTILK